MRIHHWAEFLLAAGLLAAVLALSGCRLSREEIEAAIWLNNGMDPDLCGESQEKSKYPELWDYGFYRRLNSEKFEFMPYCNPESKKWLAAHQDDFNRLMDLGLPKKKK